MFGVAVQGILCCIGATSIPGNWLKSANFVAPMQRAPASSYQPRYLSGATKTGCFKHVMR
jgi:hypothetical protein